MSCIQLCEIRDELCCIVCVKYYLKISGVPAAILTGLSEKGVIPIATMTILSGALLSTKKRSKNRRRWSRYVLELDVKSYESSGNLLKARCKNESRSQAERRPRLFQFKHLVVTFASRDPTIMCSS